MKKKILIVCGILTFLCIISFGIVFFINANGTTNITSLHSIHTTGAHSSAILVNETDPHIGQYLADPSGRPVYIYGGDSRDKSNCSGACLYNWPAYGASGITKDMPAGVGIYTRTDDHQEQYTYEGMPLYYYIGDSSGEITGNNVNNFRVATPAPLPQSSSVHSAF